MPQWVARKGRSSKLVLLLFSTVDFLQSRVGEPVTLFTCWFSDLLCGLYLWLFLFNQCFIINCRVVSIQFMAFTSRPIASKAEMQFFLKIDGFIRYILCIILWKVNATKTPGIVCAEFRPCLTVSFSLHQNYEAIMWRRNMNISQLIYLQNIKIKFCSLHP